LSVAFVSTGGSTSSHPPVAEQTTTTTNTTTSTLWNPPALSGPVAKPQTKIVTAKQIVATEPSPELASETQWDTQSTDPTAYWPSEGSPINSLPISAQITFACIRYHESRNHLTSVNVYSGDGGLYQFSSLIWQAYGGLQYAPKPEQATGNEQDQVAVNVYNHNGGFYPEWSADNC